MFKKTTIFAIAVGTVAALALPASAPAAWKHHDTALSNDAQVGFTGNVRFQGKLGGVECQITSRTKFLAGQTTATVETFVTDPTNTTVNCKGLGGLAFCQIHNLTPQSPNWTAHTVQNFVSIAVETQTIHSEPTGQFCPVITISLTAGTVLLVPDQPNTVSSVTLTGNLQAHLTTNGGPVDTETVQTSGTLAIESPNLNTYSL